MENPESGSIQMKNPVNMPEGSTWSSEGLGDYKNEGWGWVENDEVGIAERHKVSRKKDAQSFRERCNFGSSMEQRTCICSHGTYLWSDQSSGIMWVGVQGMDSICVVTRAGDVDRARLLGSLCFYSYKSIIREFGKSIISELEDLADTLHQIYGLRIEKPFGVVSAIPDSKGESADKAATLPSPRAAAKFDEEKEHFEKREHDEEKAIEFLREKTKGDLAFTVDETIQTAISALQHLFQQEFQANEIQVFVLDPNYRVSIRDPDANYKDILVKDMQLHEIEEHLCVINGLPGSGTLGSGRSGMENTESGSIEMKNTCMPANMPEDSTCHSGTDHCRRKCLGFYEIAEWCREARKTGAKSFQREYNIGSSMDLSSQIAQMSDHSIDEPFDVGTNEVRKESDRKNATSSHTAIMGLCTHNFGIIGSDSRTTYKETGLVAKNDVEKLVDICDSVVMAGSGDTLFFKQVSSLVPIEVARKPLPQTMDELVEFVVGEMNQLILRFGYDLRRQADPKKDFSVGNILLGTVNDQDYEMYSITINPERSKLVYRKESCVIFNYGSGSGRLRSYQAADRLDDWILEFEAIWHVFKCIEHAIMGAPKEDKTCGGNIRLAVINELGCRRIEFRLEEGRYNPEPYFL